MSEVELKGIMSEELPEEEKKAPAARGDREALKAKGILAKQKKMTVFIPIDPLNPRDTALYVALNGYGFNVPRGRKVDVPKGIAAILRERGFIG